MSNVKKLSEIKPKPVLRNRTWFPTLDTVYGMSVPEKGDVLGNIGMPIGKISLWAGQSGVGKSRLCIDVAKNFSTKYSDGDVLYFQTESPLEDFASWAKNTTQYDRIFCSGENKIDEIIKIIYQVKPKLVFIDSVNEIEEFETGNKKEARRIIQGVNDKPGLKKATHDVGAHLVLLGQLNQDGKTIKGGTSLPHLVDIALNVVKTEDKNIFRVEVGTKHRYGSTENVALFRHTNEGVIEYKEEVDLQKLADEAKIEVAAWRAKQEEQALNKVKTMTKAQIEAVLRDRQDRLSPNIVRALKDRHFEFVKAEAVADGRIRLDANGRVIPKSEWDKFSGDSVLDKLNKSVGRFFGLIE
jgi:predicted ATP-dependent serine protease